MNFSLLHKRENLLGENCSHGLTLTNTASQKSNPLPELFRDNKRRRKSGDKTLEIEAVCFRTPVFSPAALASGRLHGVTAFHQHLHKNSSILFRKRLWGPKGKMGKGEVNFLLRQYVSLNSIFSSAWPIQWLSLILLMFKQTGHLQCLCMKFHLYFFPQQVVIWL